MRCSTAASYAAYLYGDTTLVGPAKVLKVNKGDTVRIEVFAQFVDMPGNETIVNPFLLGNAIAGAFSGTFGLTEGGGPLLASLGNYAGALGVLGNDSPDDAPNATLNYMFFGENFEFDTTMYNGYDFDVITSGAAANNWEMLTLEKVANRKGYLFIYVANESPGDKVYFDDLKITHIEHPVVQYDDYNLGGITFNSYVSGVANKYLYQNKELVSDLDLDMFDFGWRGMDRNLLRTWQVDPMADKFYSHSPYSWALNNPLRFIDPDGREARDNQAEHREDMEGRAERFAARRKGGSASEISDMTSDSGKSSDDDNVSSNSSNDELEGAETGEGEPRQDDDFCPCTIDLNDESKVIEQVLRNFKFVESGGELDLKEILFYSVEESDKMNGGNWLERNIGNPIGNFFLDAFGSIGNKTKEGMGNLQLNDEVIKVSWLVSPESEKLPGNNIGYRIDLQTLAEGAENGYIYRIKMISKGYEAPVITLGFKDYDVYKIVWSYIDSN